MRMVFLPNVSERGVSNRFDVSVHVVSTQPLYDILSGTRYTDASSARVRSRDS